MNNNNRISQKQGIVMIIMFIIGTSSLMMMGLEAKMDIWIAMLVAIAASSLIMLVYASLLTALPGKDFFETIEHFFGKVGSKIIFILMTWFAFDLCHIVLRNYGQFLVTVGLPETPLMFSMFMMIALCAFSVRAGVETIGRFSSQFVIFVLIFMAISILLVMPQMNINNLLPMLDNGVVPIARGAFGIVSFPFAETVVFLLVFPAFKKGEPVRKIYLTALLIGGLTILATSLTDILVLGPTMAESMYYPTYVTMASVHLGEFLQRFEVIAAIVFMIGVFLKISVLLYAASNGFIKIFGLGENRFIALPMALLVLCFALFSFDDMIYYTEYVVSVWPYYSTVFQIIIPLFLLIVIKLKLRKNKRKKLSNI